MDQFLLIQQGLIGVIVPFVTNFLKEKFPKLVDGSPVQNLFVAWALVTLCTWGACVLTQQHCTWADIQQYAMNTALLSHLVQSLLKTDPKTVSLGLPTVTIKKTETPTS